MTKALNDAVYWSPEAVDNLTVISHCCTIKLSFSAHRGSQTGRSGVQIQFKNESKKRKGNKESNQVHGMQKWHKNFVD